MALNGTTVDVVIGLAAAFTSVVTVPTGGESVVLPPVAPGAELAPPDPTATRVPLAAYTRTGQRR